MNNIKYMEEEKMMYVGIFIGAILGAIVAVTLYACILAGDESRVSSKKV